MLETVEATRRQHSKYFQRYPDTDNRNRIVDAVDDALDHKYTLFKSMHIQVLSRGERMQNLTNLVCFSSWVSPISYRRDRSR